MASNSQTRTSTVFHEIYLSFNIRLKTINNKHLSKYSILSKFQKLTKQQRNKATNKHTHNTLGWTTSFHPPDYYPNDCQVTTPSGRIHAWHRGHGMADDFEKFKLIYNKDVLGGAFPGNDGWVGCVWMKPPWVEMWMNRKLSENACNLVDGFDMEKIGTDFYGNICR